MSINLQKTTEKYFLLKIQNRFSVYERHNLFKYLLPFLVEPEWPQQEFDEEIDRMLDSGEPSSNAAAAIADGGEFPIRRTPHPSTRTVALDILQMYAFHNPSHVRQVQQDELVFFSS